jgi:hypothetical protein
LLKFKFKVSRWNFRHLSVIDQKIVGVVSTETEIWFFLKKVSKIKKYFSSAKYSHNMKSWLFLKKKKKKNYFILIFNFKFKFQYFFLKKFEISGKFFQKIISQSQFWHILTHDRCPDVVPCTESPCTESPCT